MENSGIDVDSQVCRTVGRVIKNWDLSSEGLSSLFSSCENASKSLFFKFICSVYWEQDQLELGEILDVLLSVRSPVLSDRPASQHFSLLHSRCRKRNNGKSMDHGCKYPGVRSISRSSL